MRHRVHKTIFSRDTNHRKAMIRNGVRAVVEHGKVVTTKPKATEYQRWLDKLISTAQQADVSARRELHSFFGKRDVVNTLVDKIVPLYSKRTSGFSRLVRVGTRRGDNVEMFRLELVVELPEAGSLKKPADKKTAPKTSAKKATQSVKKTAAKKASAKKKAVAPKAQATRQTKKATGAAAKTSKGKTTSRTTNK